MTELQPAAENPPPVRVLPLWRFSLAELMGFMTVGALCSAFWKLHPTTGMIAILLFLPATVQTMRATRICQHLGISLDIREHLWNFAFSCLIALVAIGFFFVSLIFIHPLGLAIYFALYYISPSVVSTYGSVLLTGLVGLIIPIKIMNHFKLRASLYELEPPTSESIRH